MQDFNRNRIRLHSVYLLGNTVSKEGGSSNPRADINEGVIGRTMPFDNTECFRFPPKDAFKYFRQAIELNDNKRLRIYCSRKYYQSGLICYDRGFFDDAIELFEMSTWFLPTFNLIIPCSLLQGKNP